MMIQAVLMGDPASFRVRVGGNPHTRDRWGRRKRVDREKAIAQWNGLRDLLEHLGVRVRVLPAVEDQPGLVFPANAGFRFGGDFYLSRLNPGRAGELGHYRRAVAALGLVARDLPAPYPFEGEADFIPVGDPSGDPAKTVYLFTYGRIERPRWAPRWGWPPVRRIYGFRSDRRVGSALQTVVGGREIYPLELVDEHHYHGDTVLCPFGPHREFLLVYLQGLSVVARTTLRHRFGDRLIPLEGSDGRAFAANSFQVSIGRPDGGMDHLLLMPDGLTGRVYRQVRSLGAVPCPVDVSEFLWKGGGAVKCMLLDLGRC